MKKSRLFLITLICLQIIFSAVVFAENDELVYIEKSFIDNAADDFDLSTLLNWGYVGSAATVSRNIVNVGGEKYLSLKSDALKNGNLGGSYYLYNTYYPIIGEGSLDFDIRLNSGKMKLIVGDDICTSSLFHNAWTLSFDADNGKISCNAVDIPYTFATDCWYTISTHFDVRDNTLDLTVRDTDSNIIFEQSKIAFQTQGMFHITNMTFTTGDRNPFSFDIDNLSYINKNTQNSSGGFMSISKDNIMKATYPKSAEETQNLIDNQQYLPRRMEYLDRGLIAVKRMNDVYLSWRWLGTEDISTAYNIYRDGVKINDTPIKESTNYVDKNGTINSKYSVRSVVDDTEVDESEEISVNLTNAISIPLIQYDYENYSSGDGMVGDLDGDGEYEIVVHRYPEDVINSDNYPLVEAYKLDGTHLWTLNIGPNDLEPTQNSILLYDINDDGKSEVIMRIGDGFIDGENVSVGDMDGDGIINYREFVYSEQYLTKGPEYLAVFNGETGGLIDKVPFEGVIARDPIINWGNGSAITHRPWKFMYAPIKIDDDGVAFVICRGIYARTGVQCWKLIDNKLTMMWDFDSNDYMSYTGQGNHNMTSGDVDYDGYDEIIYAGMAIDHDGSPLFTTHLGHGDALHLGDFDIDRAGLEVMKTNENNTAYANCSMYDARTGEVLWGEYAGRDTTRVVCDDTDPRYRGAETYTNGKAFNSKGDIVNSKGGANFLIYWDGDLLREFNDDVTISKYMAYDDKMIPLFIADDCRSNNGTKANCTVQADIFGDWREEVVLPTVDGKYLKVFSTTCPTTYKLYTLMHDPIYRAAAAWQNNAYNQPPHLGFYLGYDVENIPIPQIYTVHNGTKIFSPYTQDYRQYTLNAEKDSCYSDERFDAVLVDDYPRLQCDNPTGDAKFSSEKSSLLPYILQYYDDAVKCGGKPNYVMLPTTKVYLPNTVHFIADDEITVTDISGTPVENLADSVYYDKPNKMLKVNSDKNIWIKVTSDKYTQVFNIQGKDYIRKDSFLYDTLDEQPLSSGNDFLNSRMNINGWKLENTDENVSVITYADSTFTNKKRMVHVVNNSDNDAVLYLKRNEFVVGSSAVAEFDIQLWEGETVFENEIILSDDENNKVLSLKQEGNSLYVGSMGEYIPFAEKLETTTKYGAVYHVAATMNFYKKTMDIMLLKNDNIVASMNDVPFCDVQQSSISKFSVASKPHSRIGIDDINIYVYSGMYIRKNMKDSLQKLDSLVFANDNSAVKKQTVIIDRHNNDGNGDDIKLFDVAQDKKELSLKDIYDDYDCLKIFAWDNIFGMTPVCESLNYN